MKTLVCVPALVLFLLSPSGHAVLRTEEIAARELVRHGGELCALPLHLKGGHYTAADVAGETELCSYAVDSTVAACPKLNSTNPGVNFHRPPPGMSLEELTRRECEAPGEQHVGKYKLSISCSYSPSILVYYHVSRALGNIAGVPPAVLRTLSVERHLGLADRAVKLLRNNKPTEAITRWWTELRTQLKLGRSSTRADELFTAGFDASYGALQLNPRGESKYAEFNPPGDNRVIDFKNRNPIYAELLRRELLVPREFTPASAQRLRQLKDAADFLLLDTVLGQQDRFGNIHYKEQYYFLADDGLRRTPLLENIPPAYRERAAKVKELLLKDNDCGVAKDPVIKDAKLLDPIAHIDPATYRALRAFTRLLATPGTSELLTRGLHLTDTDVRRISRNAREAAELLESRCRSGRLTLDLDLPAHFSGAPLPRQSCGD